jgi:hypothetical protein
MLTIASQNMMSRELEDKQRALREALADLGINGRGISL